MAAMKPLIAVPTRSISESEIDPCMNGAFTTYLEAIAQAGGIPLMIPLTCGDEVAHEIFSRCHGLLLCGGEDVDPALYGEDADPKLGVTAPARDRMEMLLIERARTRRIPIWGICRGIQILNVACGGTLIQDISDDQTTGVQHRDREDSGSWFAMRHQLRFETECRLSKILGVRELKVNSLHHQAVKAVGTGLTVVGRSEDGIVEALESADDHWVVAVQCHPEALQGEHDQRWAKVFSAFIAASAEWKATSAGAAK